MPTITSPPQVCYVIYNHSVFLTIHFQSKESTFSSPHDNIIVAEKARTKSSKPRGWCQEWLAQSHQVLLFVLNRIYKSWQNSHFIFFHFMPLFNYFPFYRDGIALKKTEAKENEENKKGQVNHIGNLLVHERDFNLNLTLSGSLWRGHHPGSKSRSRVLRLRRWSFRLGVWLRWLGWDNVFLKESTWNW